MLLLAFLDESRAGFACPAGSTNGTVTRCPTAYFCPPGSMTTTSTKCYALAGASTAWSREWTASTGSASHSVITSSTVGTMFLANTTTGMDADCNTSPSRLPTLLVTPDSGAGAVGAVLFADWNGDGLFDLAGLSTVSNVVAVALRNASNYFPDASATSLAAPSGTHTLCAFDVDVDGDVDVLAFTSGSVIAMLNNGSGVLSSTLTVAGGVSAVAGVAADVNGDAAVDIIVATTSNGVRVLINSSNGSFVDESPTRMLGPTEPFPTASVAVGDVDNDGDVDLVVSGIALTRLFINNGSGYFVDSTALWGLALPVLQSGSASVSLGDVDNDGGLDMFVSVNASYSVLLTNNGSHSYAVNATWPTGGPSPLVDVNLDGGLDAPRVGYLSSLAPNVGGRSVYVRVLGRNGRMNQYGALVCVKTASSGVRVGCRVVDSGGTSAQAPYDVHVPLPAAFTVATPFDVEVSFCTGHVINKATVAAFGGVTLATVTNSGLGAVVVRDTPVLTSVTLSTVDGAPAGIGDVVNVSVIAMWGEAGLSPWLPACCVINGVNVSTTFHDVGVGGVYTLAYTVREGDGDVVAAAPGVVLTLVDARVAGGGVVSDPASESRVYGNFSSVFIDATPPVVNFTCVAWNGTLRTTNYETVCVACGLQTNEARLGCTVYWRSVGVGVTTAVSATSLTTGVVNVTSKHGDVRVLQFWAKDAAGNSGPIATLTWTVDSLAPVTVWPSGLPNLTNSNSLELAFGCSRQGCVFEYSFDDGGLIQASHVNGSGGGNIATSQADTALAIQTARLTATPTLVASVTVMTRLVSNGAVVNTSLPSTAAGTRAQVSAVRAERVLPDSMFALVWHCDCDKDAVAAALSRACHVHCRRILHKAASVFAFRVCRCVLMGRLRGSMSPHSHRSPMPLLLVEAFTTSQPAQ